MSYANDCMRSIEYLFDKYCKNLEEPVYMSKKTINKVQEKKSRGSANPISEEEKLEIIKLWKSGHKMSSIGKDLNRSVSSISNICNELKQHELLKRSQ
jgi:DNA-binding NarL/FixJ family response regulator